MTSTFCFWCLTTDYVQVVDMGTLELRITAAKPGIDGKLVRLVIIMTCMKNCLSEVEFFLTFALMLLPV